MIRDFGPYRVVRTIAEGGMAEVCLAREQGLEGLERLVVIKRIRPSRTEDEEFVTMFLDEARLIAGLSHPNIAQVFALGKDDSTYYLVMEYVHGPTLQQMLELARQRKHGGRLSKETALGIALAIAEALAYVHSLRDSFGRPLHIVHRDLNPSNVMVSHDGAVKLIDFGIAKAASRVLETRTGVVKGTQGYMAPEQFAGKPLDHRADIYTLGILLYEMCVGAHPFAQAKGMIPAVDDGFKRPRDVDGRFPKTLDQLIVRCLAIDPAERPSSVRALVSELITFMQTDHVVATMSHVAAAVRRLVPDGDAPILLNSVAGSTMFRVDDANRRPGETTVMRSMPAPRPSTTPSPFPLHVEDELANPIAVPDDVSTAPLQPARRDYTDIAKARRGLRIALVGAALMVVCAIGVAMLIVREPLKRARSTVEARRASTSEHVDGAAREAGVRDAAALDKQLEAAIADLALPVVELGEPTLKPQFAHGVRLSFAPDAVEPVDSDEPAPTSQTLNEFAASAKSDLDAQRRPASTRPKRPRRGRTRH